MLDESEAKAFLKAAQNVARHYDVQTTQKTLDWIALIGSIGSIYGTRTFAIMARKSGERAASEERGQVLHFRRPVRPQPEPVATEVKREAPTQPPSYTPSVVPAAEDSEFGNGF